ncbi:MAG: SLBB domain-containing protein [Bacteroidetes bacterium]|nr:SLBB domain-containing protein [Bacteroidota bacterium]
MDPESISEYEQRNGYTAMKKIVMNKVSREEVIKTILDSGLRGRGGGGFPTGLKWKFANANKSEQKYVICNADEGDPGAFMDRSVLEGDPHSILEGMIIAAYAIEATGGVIYCRAEYPLAIKRLNIAIRQAHEKGYLGKDIFGNRGWDFDIYIKEGAGAFVCGEETALIASIEGERGMPRKRPPFPASSGLWKKPTNINNVETYANVPWIILNGAEAYAQYGTEKSKGTKVFALAGKIRRSGLVEVPMGITIKDVIFKLGGGIKNNKRFKAVQLGGPSGGCIPDYLSDTIVDYDSVNATGAIMGSGGMVVMDETTCMVDVAKFFLDFTRKESCGKCTFCRMGTMRMLEILERITNGQGREGDIEKLEELAYQIKDNSLCGLGQTAPNPVLTTIRYFRDEYEAHIGHKKCPAKVCRPLLTYTVDQEKCTGCVVCLKNCPAKAITGERKKPHLINQETCTKCGVCFSKCKFESIILS